MNDPRDRAVGGRPLRFDLERAGAVDRPGEHRLPGPLVCGPGLASHGRLVDRRLAGEDDAVDRDALARPDEHQIADRDFIDRDVDEFTRSPHRRRGRCQRHERSDRMTRPFKTPDFEPLRHAKQPDDGRGLEPLAECQRAGDGDHHQQVDVERAGSNGAPGPHGRTLNRERDRRRVRTPREQRNAGAVCGRTSADREAAKDDQPRQAAARRGGCRRACRARFATAAAALPGARRMGLP